MVACFVNSHSLLTYIPYLQFSPPLTINGMFYCIRRTVLDGVGGFDGLEETLADDFAIARRMRQHGLRLLQTPLLPEHGVPVQFYKLKPGKAAGDKAASAQRHIEA